MTLFDFDPANVRLAVRGAFSYRPRIHDNAISVRLHSGLLYVIRGKYRYEYENGAHELTAGMLGYLPPGNAPYRYRVLSGAETETIQIEFCLTDENGAPLVYAPHPIAALKDTSGEVRLCMESVVCEFAKNDSAARLQLYAEMLHLLAVCEKNAQQPQMRRARRLIAPAVQYLQENYVQPMKIRTLADMCCLSESQFRRLFTSCMGRPPLAYRNGLLMQSARALLESGEFRVSEVAEMLGFRDIYAFSHSFKKTFGIPPGQCL